MNKIAKIKLIKKPAKCVWTLGSSSKITGKSEMPELCKEKKCDGHDSKCERYMPMTEGIKNDD